MVENSSTFDAPRLFVCVAWRICWHTYTRAQNYHEDKIKLKKKRNWVQLSVRALSFREQKERNLAKWNAINGYSKFRLQTERPNRALIKLYNGHLAVIVAEFWAESVRPVPKQDNTRTTIVKRPNDNYKIVARFSLNVFAIKINYKIT